MATGIVKDDLFGYEQTVTIACLVDDKVRLLRPPYKGIPFSSQADEKYYRYGFRILKTDLGEFVEDSGDTEKSWVVYHHKKSGKQTIEFISDELGLFKFYVVIQGITVHDHASIVMGGPAYATYFTEPAQEPEE
ncbi:MAG: hypothetical protein ACTSQY_05435 [Candidatus Odinarchaeia archaeon]